MIRSLAVRQPTELDSRKDLRANCLHVLPPKNRKVLDRILRVQIQRRKGKLCVQSKINRSLLVALNLHRSLRKLTKTTFKPIFHRIVRRVSCSVMPTTTTTRNATKRLMLCSRDCTICAVYRRRTCIPMVYPFIVRLHSNRRRCCSSRSIIAYCWSRNLVPTR